MIQALMLGEVEGAVARVWRVRDPAECAAFKKSKVTLTDAAECWEPVSVPWWLGHKNDVHLRSMLRMTIRVLSASDPFAPSSDPGRTHTEFACWMSGALEGNPTQLFLRLR